MDSFVNKEYDKVILLYNQFKKCTTQIVINEQFLPIQASEESTSDTGDYIFGSNKKNIVDSLIPKSLKTQLYKSVLDSHASEHGAENDRIQGY